MANHYKKSETRDIIEGLNGFLADTAIVYYKTHAFHWNVEGANFYSLHLMFEKFYIELWESMDEIAERIRALGEKVPPNYANLLQNATIEEHEATPRGQIMVQLLRDDYYALAQKANEVGEIASKKDDLVTTDMMTRRAAFLEKAAWMLQSTVID